MAENTENVKKIRELEDFDASVQLSEKDYLIVATNEDADGDGTNERIPLTKKATIAQAVETYNNSIATPPSEPFDPSIPAWSNSASYNVGDRVIHNNKVYECIKAHTSSIPSGGPNDKYWKLDEAGNAPDPEDQPGYEEIDPVTGKPIKRITTPVNGGNLDNFLDPDGGLKTVDFCQGANKEEVACDGSEGEVKYKTKKLALDLDDSGAGFTGPEATYQYAFPSTLRNYKDGILTSISYGFGKFLEHFAPLISVSGTNATIAPRYFSGMSSSMNPDFGLTIYANDSAEQNFDDNKGGSWFFHLATMNWYFLNLGNTSRLNANYTENYWVWNERLGWFWLSLDIWPYIYLHSDRTNGSNTVSKGWVWASEETETVASKDLSFKMYFYSQNAWIDIQNFTAASDPPSATPPAPPTVTITSSVPLDSEGNADTPPDRI